MVPDQFTAGLLGRRVVVLVAAAVLLGLGACGGSDQTAESLHGVPLSRLSETVRDLAVWQTDALAEPPAAPFAADVRLFFRLRQDLTIEARHAAAIDTLWQRLETQPTHFLWLEAAAARVGYLDDYDRLDAVLTTAAGPDSTGPVSCFIDARFGWGYDPEAPQWFFDAAARAAELDAMQRLWLETRLALVESERGQPADALARIERTVVEAWQVGGPSLSACWWYDLGMYSQQLGRLDDALVAAHVALDCARVVDDPIQEIRGHIILGKALRALGEYGDAAVVAGSAERLARDGGHGPWVMAAIMLRAEIAEAAGDRRASLDQYRKALDIELAAADTGGAVRSILLIASSHDYLGEPEAAFTWLARADSLNAAGATHGLDGHIAAIRMSVLLRAGDFAHADSLREAIGEGLPVQGRRQIVFELIEEGLDSGRPDLAYRGLAEAQGDEAFMVREGSYDPVLDLAVLSARFHARQGEFPRAYQHLETAAGRVDDGTTLHARWDYADCRGQVAELAGDDEAAVRSYREALEIAGELGDPNLTNRSRIRLGEVLIGAGRLDEARDLFRDSRRAPEYWTRFAAELLSGCAAAAAGAHDEALARFAAADSLLRADAPADLRARLRLEQGRSLAALGQPREAFTHLADADLSPGFGISSSAEEVHRAFHRPLHREIAEARISLLFDHPELAGDDDPALAALAVAEGARWRVDPSGPAPDLLMLRSLRLRAGSPIAAYFVGQARAFGWCGTDQGWSMFEIEDRDRLVARVRSVQTDMEVPGTPISWSEARDLARSLLDPVHPHWQPGRPLQLVAPGLLADLPWPALPLSDDDPASRLAVDQGPIVHLAGLRAPAMRPTSPSPASGRLLAVGVNESGSDPRLRQPETEARAVAAAWSGQDAVSMTGAEAEWSLVRAQGLGAFAVIHVASHAVVTEGLPGCSTLRLTGAADDQPVTIPEARALQLSADLVYLSCCEGARLVRDAGTGLDSFTRAFLQAGAGAVIASTRRVDDDAALDLALSFYRNWSDNTNQAASLQAAQLEIRGSRSQRRHPFFWAYYQIHSSGPVAG